MIKPDTLFLEEWKNATPPGYVWDEPETITITLEAAQNMLVTLVALQRERSTEWIECARACAKYLSSFPSVYAGAKDKLSDEGAAESEC